MLKTCCFLALLVSTQAQDKTIRWSHDSTYVVDVSGFDSSAKTLILWHRGPVGQYTNDNEHFNVEEYSGISQILWASTKNPGNWCLTANGKNNGDGLSMTNCRGDQMQDWALEATGSGYKIKLARTNQCVNVPKYQASSGATLKLWECNSDQMQSFIVDGFNPPSPPPYVPPVPTPPPYVPPAPTPPPYNPPASADDLINEFNDPSMGIAFTMIPGKVWSAGPGNGKGNNDMDSAAFYPLSDMSVYHSGSHQQAVTIVTKDQDMNPYDGGYGTYGLAFHITENKEFWKYFQSIGEEDPNCGAYKKGNIGIVAKPGDGFATMDLPQCRISLYKSGKPYAWFTEKKNAILGKYNTVYHNHDYNEFDTNGLSPKGLAGVFVNEQWYKAGPSSDTMCRFFKRADPSRTSWPIYGYKWHQLYVKQILDCGRYARKVSISNTVLV